MCGILFSIPTQSQAAQQEKRVIEATNKMGHRGPDEKNTIKIDEAFISHRRLSIVDLANSHQPMTDRTNRYCLTFNGEIYNYKELKKRLEAKWQFNTQGDTEVILAGLITEGASFIPAMEGMWSFAFWDTHEKNLLLSRDRLGKKPLYFYQDSLKEIHVASELPTLLRLLHFQPKEDERSRSDYIKQGYFMPGHTIFKNIYEVLPGHNLKWRKGFSLRQEQYWQICPKSILIRGKEAKAEVTKALTQAVQKRLIADVEIGAFLSGGIDSSLIVSLMKKLGTKSPKTFSIGFEESSYDETIYAAQIAKKYQTDHHVEMLGALDHNQLSKLIINNLGQPFADASILPTYLVSKLASKSVKVALTGDGGDELFSGYQRYTARAILQWYLLLPKKIRSNFENVIRAIPEPARHHSASIIKKAHLFVDATERMAEEHPYHAPLQFSKRQFEALLPGEWNNGHAHPKELDETSLDDVSRMMYADTLIYLPQDILLKVDRASMATSLETRSPFLDHNLVETAFSIPTNMHRTLICGKKILEDSFYSSLPKSIWKRKKQGFGVPVGKWFSEALGDRLQLLLSETDSPLNHPEIINLLNHHRSGQRDYGLKLWAIYCYLLWRVECL